MPSAAFGIASVVSMTQIAMVLVMRGRAVDPVVALLWLVSSKRVKTPAISGPCTLQRGHVTKGDGQ